MGTKKSEVVAVPQHLLHKHIPEKKQYNSSEILCDLLDFAALHLEIGARICFWQPVFKGK